MKTFTIDPTREPEIKSQHALDFIEYCERVGYAIIGIEGGVDNDGGFYPDLGLILDNSKARGATFQEYIEVCKRSAKLFIENHLHLVNRTYIFTLVTEQDYYEFRARWSELAGL